MECCLKEFNEGFPGNSIAADLNSALVDIL